MCLRTWGNYGSHTCMISAMDHVTGTEGRVGVIRFKYDQLWIVHVCHCGSSMEEGVGDMIQELVKGYTTDERIKEAEFYKQTLQLT